MSGGGPDEGDAVGEAVPVVVTESRTVVVSTAVDELWPAELAWLTAVLVPGETEGEKLGFVLVPVSVPPEERVEDVAMFEDWLDPPLGEDDGL